MVNKGLNKLNVYLTEWMYNWIEKGSNKWMNERTIGWRKAFHLPLHVERCHNLWDSQVLSDGTRHSHLINFQVGVWCNHCSGREVHSLSHEITSHTSLFTLQSLLDRLQRTPPSLESLSREIAHYVKPSLYQSHDYHMTLPLASLAVHCPPLWPHGTAASWHLLEWYEEQPHSSRSWWAAGSTSQCQPTCEWDHPIRITNSTQCTIHTPQFVQLSPNIPKQCLNYLLQAVVKIYFWLQAVLINE